MIEHSAMGHTWGALMILVAIGLVAFVVLLALLSGRRRSWIAALICLLVAIASLGLFVPVVAPARGLRR